MSKPTLSPRSETLPDDDHTGDQRRIDDTDLVEGPRTGSDRHAEQFVRLHVGAMGAVDRRILGGDTAISDAAASITGAALPVDGGWTAQ